jgi:hypothetical protein
MCKHIQLVANCGSLIHELVSLRVQKHQNNRNWSVERHLRHGRNGNYAKTAEGGSRNVWLTKIDEKVPVSLQYSEIPLPAPCL